MITSMTLYWNNLTQKFESQMPNTIIPDHYKIPNTNIDIGTAIEHLPFWIANAIKYLYRVDGKNTPVENLDKAIECIQREKARRVSSNSNGVRQAGTPIVSWQEQLRQNSPTTGHIRSQVGQSTQDLSTRGSGYVGASEGYETYRVDSGYEV